MPYLANADTGSSIDDAAAAYLLGPEFDMVVDGLSENAQRQGPFYGPQNLASSLYGGIAPAAQTGQSLNWNRDLVAFFPNTPSQSEEEAYDTEDNCSPSAPSLAPPLQSSEWSLGRYGTSEEFNDEDMGSNFARIVPSCLDLSGQPLPKKLWSPSNNRLKLRAAQIAKPHKRRQKFPIQVVKEFPKQNDRPQRCREPDCDYACNRPEHLRRHEASKHCKEFDGGPEMLPCAFEGCKDRRTGRHREIQARMDNLKAHYTKTHFRYGNSEKGGKNDRKSMKEAYEMGLSEYDSRWTLLL